MLDLLRKLRKSRRRIFSTFITTYSINLSFYENVVLRHLEAAGSRLNVVLADAGELAKAFANESTSPRRAGTDYVLIPTRASGAFHPKIIALFSEEGLSVALGSHNLTEAGLTRNGEISATFGFERQMAPVNVSVPVADYLMECAGELAPGDLRVSQRLATRLRQYARRGSEGDADVAFVSASASGALLLDKAFTGRELANAKRILAMGPYFDDNLAFVRELKRRAPKAELVLAIQPSHTVLKFPARMPAGVRLRDSEVLPFDSPKPFLHAKAIVVETGGQTVVALGSANPSAPAWLADGDRNFEALAVFRGSPAKKIVLALALDQMWKAPEISKQQLKQIELRSRKEAEEESPTPDILIVTGLWQDGFVTAQIGTGFRRIKAVSAQIGGASEAIALEGISVTKGVLRFAASGAGTFTLQTAERTGPVIIVAASVRDLSQTLVSSETARLIDELGRLAGGAAPSEELLNLCDKILLSPGDKSEEPSASLSSNRTARTQDRPSDSEAYTPRGIGIQDKASSTG
ncbi:MAG: hypothetical protein JSS22_03665, partial [Proteobacteria bacterium]|nr:hypothetical protein [Pseudomonadota bacterium]